MIAEQISLKACRGLIRLPYDTNSVGIHHKISNAKSLTGPGFHDIFRRSSTWLNKRSPEVETCRTSFLRMLYFIKGMKISNLFSEDISFREYGMLRLIVEIEAETGSPDVWVSDIVKRVEVTPQAVSKFVRLAIRKGYVERIENTADRRSTGIRITARGRAVLQQTGEELSAFYNQVSNMFSEEERIAMHGLMNKFQRIVQENYLKCKKK
jgi:DNA-binding MarR family transcriptional regulator